MNFLFYFLYKYNLFLFYYYFFYLLLIIEINNNLKDTSAVEAAVRNSLANLFILKSGQELLQLLQPRSTAVRNSRFSARSIDISFFKKIKYNCKLYDRTNILTK